MLNPPNENPPSRSHQALSLGTTALSKSGSAWIPNWSLDALNLPTHVYWYDISLKIYSLNKQVGKLKLRIWKYFTTMDRNELITSDKDSS